MLSLDNIPLSLYLFTFYSLPTFEIKNEEEYVSKCFF